MRILEDETDSIPWRRIAVVLCVDDDPETLQALSRCLRNEPYLLITAGAPAEALAVLGEVPVDLVIADQRMPEMSGTELLREARQRSPRTARAILTGYDTPSTICKGLESGAETFLRKPWNDVALRSTILRILDRLGRLENRREVDDGPEPFDDGPFDLGGEGG